MGSPLGRGLSGVCYESLEGVLQGGAVVRPRGFEPLTYGFVVPAKIVGISDNYPILLTFHITGDHGKTSKFIS